MTQDTTYPASFPNAEEELFLKLILCREIDFLQLFEQWKQSIVFNDIDYATMRLLPLLYLRLKPYPIHDEITGRIKGTYRLAWYKNQRILGATREIVKLLQDQHIPVMLMKGIPLLINAYKNPGARFMNDADLYIHKDHVVRAITLMQDHGWLPQEYLFSSTKTISSSLLDTYNEVTYTINPSVEVDLHWNIFEPIKIHTFFSSSKPIDHSMSLDLVWSETVPFLLQSVPCLIPCNEDLLIHVILHGATHNNHRAIRWVVDASTVIRNNPIRWDFLLERIHAFDCIIEMQTAFSYLEHKIEISIPESFTDKLANLPVDSSKLKTYYKAALPTDTVSLFKKVLFLFRTYLRNTTSITFTEFLCHEWKLKEPREVLPFMSQKLKMRFFQLFKKKK